MAHGITFSGNHAHAAYGRGMSAWHRFGTVFDDLMTTEQVLEAVKPPLIEKVQTFYQRDGVFVPAEKFCLAVAEFPDGRSVPLGSVKEGYAISQFRDFATIFQPLADRAGAVVDAAGVLDEGKIFWALARLPDSFEYHGDRADRFILFYTRNDGGGKVQIRTSHIRVVCQNTLAVSLRGKASEISIRHSGDMQAKLDDAARRVEEALQGMEEGERTFKDMFEVTLNRQERAAMVTEVLGIDMEKKLSTYQKNQLEEISWLFQHGRGARDASPADRETLWHTYNTLVEYVDHSTTMKGGKNRLKRFSSSMFGDGLRKKEAAFQVAQQLIDNRGQMVEVPVDAALEDLVQF